MLSVEEKNARRREKYRQNPTLYIERSKKWNKDNPEYVKNHNEEYYEQRKMSLLENNRIYRQTPQGKAAALRAREKSREKNRERARLWRLNHPGATTIQQQAWKAKNPEKYRLSNANKYGRRKQLGAANWKLSVEQLSAFVISQDGGCYYCEKSLLGGFHLDHKTPLSKGGLHVLKNMCLSCPSCNLRKHNKTEIEFRTYLTKER